MKSKTVIVNKDTCVDIELTENKSSNNQLIWYSMLISVFAKNCATFANKTELLTVEPQDLRNLAHELNRLSFELENKIENDAQLENEK